MDSEADCLSAGKGRGGARSLTYTIDIHDSFRNAYPYHVANHLELISIYFPSVSAVNTYEAKQYYDKHFTEEYSKVWQMGEITPLWDEAKVVSGRKKRLPETIVVPVATECK